MTTKDVSQIYNGQRTAIAELISEETEAVAELD